MPAAAFIDAVTQGFTATSSPTVTSTPSGWSAGNLALLAIGDPAPGSPIATSITTGPSGWTLFSSAPAAPTGTDIGLWLYWRVLTGGDSLPSYTLHSARDSTATLVTVTNPTGGTTEATIFDGTAVARGSTSAGTSLTTGDLTVNGSNRLTISFISVDAAAAVTRPYWSVVSSPTGAVKQEDAEGTNNVEMGVATLVADAGTVTHTWTAASSDTFATLILAVLPSTNQTLTATLTASNTCAGTAVKRAGLARSAAGTNTVVLTRQAKLQRSAATPNVTTVRAAGSVSHSGGSTATAVLTRQPRATRVAVSPNAAASRKDAAGTRVAVGAATGLLVRDGRLVRAGVSTNAAVASAMRVLLVTLQAVQTTAAEKTLRPGRVMAANGSASALAARMMGRTFTAADVQAPWFTVVRPWVVAAGGTNTAVMVRRVQPVRAAASPNIAPAVRAAPAVSRTGASTSVAALIRRAGKILTAGSAGAATVVPTASGSPLEATTLLNADTSLDQIGVVGYARVFAAANSAAAAIASLKVKAAGITAASPNVGAAVRQVRVTRLAAVTAVPVTVRTVTRSATAASGSTGAVIRLAGRARAAASGSAASVAAIKAKLVSLTAGSAQTPVLGRLTVAARVATSPQVALSTREAAKRVPAVANSAAAAATKRPGKTLTASNTTAAQASRLRVRVYNTVATSPNVASRSATQLTISRVAVVVNIGSKALVLPPRSFSATSATAGTVVPLFISRNAAITIAFGTRRFAIITSTGGSHVMFTTVLSSAGIMTNAGTAASVTSPGDKYATILEPVTFAHG